MRHLGQATLIALLAVLGAPAPSLVAQSARVAAYEIDVRLDHPARTLTGTARIRWRNPGTAPVDALRLHLYWNAWRDASSSWMREAALGGARYHPQPDDWARVDLTALSLVGEDGTVAADLLPSLTFVQPDDGNADDRTLAAVSLPAAVAPGASIGLQLQWTARVPRTFARTGAIGDYYFLAHWFPRLGMVVGDRWVARQFHANTEFFTEFGRYDVRMTVPRGWIVGATGREQSRIDNPDGTTTHRYTQDEVHDFTWTTSPDYVEHRQRFEHAGLPPVDIRLLMQPEHAGQEDRHFAATMAALRYYGEWYGAYPYGHITVIDPAYQSGAGGMEYPTLFTAGTRWWAPRQTNVPEAVTIHEAGHQFWYGLVRNNEVDHAWLDEGLNSFSDERVQALAFQPNYLLVRFFGGFVPWQFHDIPLRRETDGNGLNGYRAAADRDDPATPTFLYWPATHGYLTYFKTALWLHTLERHLGWETLQRAMAVFFERWKYRHPQPDDFFATINEVSGRDLTWFFDQVHRGSRIFDYAVEQVTSDRTDTSTRSTVVVRRIGDGTFPVDVVTTFADGERVTEAWDGRDRWKAYHYQRPSPVATVQVDPARVLLLDVNYTNNSYSARPRAAAAATKWSLAWMVWVQDLLLTWSLLV